MIDQEKATILKNEIEELREQIYNKNKLLQDMRYKEDGMLFKKAKELIGKTFKKGSFSVPLPASIVYLSDVRSLQFNNCENLFKFNIKGLFIKEPTLGKSLFFDKEYMATYDEFMEDFKEIEYEEYNTKMKEFFNSNMVI